MEYNHFMNSFDGKGRRRFLKLTMVAAVAPLLPPAQRAEALPERRLAFFHTHTGEHLDVAYKRGDAYVEESLRAVNQFLFDFRTGESIEIDPTLLDLIFDLREQVGGRGTFEVISAYRSPKTNSMLRTRSSGVAKKSQHLLGKAIDIRLTGVDLKTLHQAALAMRRGGVGYYPQSNFIHVDTGRVRRW